MQWKDPGRAYPTASLLALARAAVEREPDNPLLNAKLGTLLRRAEDFPSAVAAFESAATRDPAGFNDWGALGQCYLQLRRFDDVLALAGRLADREPTATLETARGLALQELGRPEAARAALTRAIALRPTGLRPHRALLKMIARRNDGGELLEACDAMPAELQALGLVTGHRALAFSMLGRADAGTLVDLHTHVARLHFEPPAEFGSIEEFNRTLANEILNDPDARPPDREADVNYKRDLYGTPAKRALRDFTRDAIDAYIATMPRLGALLPPAAGSLWGAHTVLRGSGRNGQHLHSRGYISTIYYVSLPPRDRDSDRGALMLGCCDEYTGGHAATWGTRRIRPEPGTLLVFPAHIFHDVVPTGSEEPRISVVADLLPSIA